MKAALLEQLGSLVVREVADPEIPPYGALCKLLYGATCSGTDIHLMDGHIDWAIKAAPTILGHESIGQVIEVGPKVRSYKVGDLVTRVGATAAADGSYSVTWGGFAELGVAMDHWAMAEDGLPEEDWAGATVNQIIPADFDPRACTMMTTWRETLSYATRMGLSEGDKVLVIGSGGVGLSFAAHARNAGARRIDMAGNIARREAAWQVGVNHYLDYHDGALSWMIGSLCPEGFDVVIDAVGTQATMDLAVEQVAAGGIVGVYGIGEMGQAAIDPNKARGEFRQHDSYDEAETHEQVVEMMQRGKLDATVWMDLDRAYPLDDINAAFDAVRKRECIKALVQLSED